jgi:hypothetical protein
MNPRYAAAAVRRAGGRPHCVITLTADAILPRTERQPHLQPRPVIPAQAGIQSEPVRCGGGSQSQWTVQVCVTTHRRLVADALPNGSLLAEPAIGYFPRPVHVFGWQANGSEPEDSAAGVAHLPGSPSPDGFSVTGE